MSHNNGPKHSEPVHGHEGTSFEATDAKAGTVIWSLAAIGATLVVVFAVTVYWQNALKQGHPLGELPSPLAPARVLAPAPQLQVHPWEELPEMRANEAAILNSTGKDKDGHFHVPIDKAMDAVASRAQVAPGAPRGLTTPGGGGREFAGSLSGMPSGYKTPAIQGEIQKNAQ